MNADHIHGKDPECLAVFEHLSEYIDGEMEAKDCAHLEAHMSDCPPCIEFLKSLRASIEASHQFSAEASPTPMPPQMTERLKEAWEAALSRRRG